MATEDEDDEPPTVIYRPGPAEWTLDIRCQVCGWPWRFIGTTETRTIDFHRVVACPNCGAQHEIDFHDE